MHDIDKTECNQAPLDSLSALRIRRAMKYLRWLARGPELYVWENGPDWQAALDLEAAGLAELTRDQACRGCGMLLARPARRKVRQ